MRRRGWAGGPAVSARQHVWHPPGGTPAEADLDERPDDVPHHVVEKGIGGDQDADPVALRDDTRREHVTHGVAGAPRRRAERREVVLAAQFSRDLRHRDGVEADLGSAVLSVKVALEELDDAVREQVRLVDAPFVEGAVAAAVTAATGADLAAVAAAAEQARTIRKF